MPARVSAALEGPTFRLRRAAAADVDFMVDLVGHDDVEPFMAAVSRAGARRAPGGGPSARRQEPELARQVRASRSTGEPRRRIAFDVANRRSRIAYLHAIMLDPAYRGRGLADRRRRGCSSRHLVFDLDYHRVQLEVYGFNEPALRHFERAGFSREGVRRQAYWRHGAWVDGILFGLVREDLEAGRRGVRHRRRHRVDACQAAPARPCVLEDGRSRAPAAATAMRGG